MTETVNEIESTTEPIRKLASVRHIAAIEPIKGADRIVCATIDGWKVVTQKSNNFEVGDLVVYFEIDSFLPVEERYEFLRSSSFKSTKHLGDGFRIKTIKLKGQVSQGLILPLSEFKLPFELVEGLDLTEYLGVKKYEKPLSPQLAGVAKGNFPSFIRKTDQERIQNIFNELKDPGSGLDYFDLWETTLKLDGSSMTVYYNKETFGVCSRNLDLKETDDNTFWQVARKLDLEAMLRNIGRNVALQGELMGPGIQGNREKLDTHDFFVFDIWDIDTQRYLSHVERKQFLSGLKNIRTVPEIGEVYLKDFDTVDDFLNYADISSLNNSIAEGVVFKRYDGAASFKVINQKFLLTEED